MQDTLIFVFLPLTLLLLLASKLRHASLTHKATAYAWLATIKSAIHEKLPKLLREPEVFVLDRIAAHRLLVGGAATGGAFSDRPRSSVASSILSRHRHTNINSAPYGSLWRALRRNLTSEVLHPSRLRLYAPARRRAIVDLVADLDQQRTSVSGVVLAAETMRKAMFGLVTTMCFGDGVDADLVTAMSNATADLIECFESLRVLSTLPSITGLIYRNRWRKMIELRQLQEELYLPLIDGRRTNNGIHDGEPPAYVDTLVNLNVPADEHAGNRRGKRKLNDGDLVGLCSEFLGAGTEPAAAELNWIMANLVKQPDVQRKLREEIDAAVAEDADLVDEEVLGKLAYLNAVIMEALRLHPTVPIVFRQVMPDDHVVLDGRPVPVGTAVLFPIPRLSRDKTAWTDLREFRPERFMPGGEGENVSLVAAAGSAGEIKMMPFGAGRRMCPGMGVAILHLGYFVANLVREFEWVEAEGEHAVDLRPKIDFLAVMKRPLRVRLVRRREAKQSC